MTDRTESSEPAAIAVPDLSRRRFVAGVGGLAATSLVAGPALAQAQAREAPALAQAVAANQLPPLAQRLPQSPLVVTPVERVGQYGGTLRRGLRGSQDHNGILRMVGNQGLVRWNLEFTDVLPNVAERWEVNQNATEFTFHLRQGMKWSDGKPFTADDVVFVYEDCLANSELYRSPPALYVVNGRFVEVTKINDHTVRFKFAGPYGMFLTQLATPLGQHPTLFQKEYCKQFHPKYNAAGLPALMRAASVNSWGDLFRAKCGDIEIPTRWGNPEKPTIDPWVIADPYAGGATRVTMRRNAYFWQVDTEGKQLPYIDAINFSIAQDVESLMLDVISGRIDIQERHIDTLQNKPTVAQNAQRGNYRLFETINAGSQQVTIYPNLCHKDPTVRAILNNRDFRVALSIAINRQEIIDIVYLGQSEPWQLGPRPTHPWYHERLARQHTEHNPREANAILDRLGYTRRNAQRIRLRPDGQPLFFAVDVIPTLNPDQVDTLELVKRHWAEIGVDMKVNTIERALYYTRGDNNDHDFAVWFGPGGLEPLIDARDWVCMHPQGSRFGIPWAMWYASGGREGQEPPDNQKRRMQLYDQARETTDVRRQGDLMKQILDLAAESFDCFGPCLAPNLFGIASNRLRNVPARMPYAWSWPHPGPSMPQQFFFTS
ncbi:MAG: ABC transporter substrate-binding protein [Alphaproteobacteria bacterium]|nr:ABC transporter substrate-binding protein [Alphaproteobacteria bacterium]